MMSAPRLRLRLRQGLHSNRLLTQTDDCIYNIACNVIRVGRAFQTAIKTYVFKNCACAARGEIKLQGMASGGCAAMPYE